MSSSIHHSVKGDFSPSGKLENVTSIHKKDYRSRAVNYRRVSLTSVIGKVVESLILQSPAGTSYDGESIIL